MQATVDALILLLAVLVSGLVARWSRLPPPLVQVALGAAMVYAGLHALVLEPALFFLLFLPPLLFLDGWRMPRDALKRDARTVLKLALGLVLFTVLGMGWFIHWLIPAMPLPVAFALAAVIAPTDPIAVSAIATRTPVPPRLMHILQGEALLNDASGLVCLRFATAAAMTGSFSLPSALGSFLYLALVGVGIGVGATWAASWLASGRPVQQRPDGGAQILATLLIPFGVYLLAEQFNGSGILAAAAAGLTMSLTDVWPWHAATRLRRTAVWDTVQLVANGSIFVLLGQQLPALLAAAPRTAQASGAGHVGWLALDAVVIVAVLLLLRCVWVGVSLRLSDHQARQRGEPALVQGGRAVLAASLAGVRGAVTLAGVLTLPFFLPDGSPFPARDLAILLAAAVIVLSLVLASTALPWVLRGLHWAGPAAQHAEEEGARRAGALAAIIAIQSAPAAAGATPAQAQAQAAVADRLVAIYRGRIERLATTDPTGRQAEHDTERRLRLAGLRAERAELLRHGRAHGLEELALRRLVRELDFQEARYSG